MNLKTLDIALLTKLTSVQVDNVTCLECCKYYIAPETAACGHTLCHFCWKGRRTCPSCAAPLERRLLKLNLPLQSRTEHIHHFGDLFEKLFEIKLDEFVLDVSIPEVETMDDPTKNVKDWLASSQNHFSAALPSSELTQELNNPIEISSSKIQIHSDSKKSKSPSKVVYIHQPQDDWDKIEQLPDGEEKTATKENETNKHKNVLSLIEENEYTIRNPRRSSRKKDMNQSEPTIRGPDISLERSSKNSSAATDQKSNQAKQNWNNVKKMRKEFSKLNKENRSKLNVSIEMCKKAQKTTVQPNTDNEQQKNTESDSPLPDYIIEDNTPMIDQENTKKHIESKRHVETTGNDSTNIKQINVAENVLKSTTSKNETNVPSFKENPINSDQNLKFSKSVSNVKSTAKSLSENIDENHHTLHINSPKMSFVKKGALCPRQEKTQNIQTINIDNNINDNANADDIEITIKIGSTQANIVIKKKTNNIQLKVNTDREVQTSLGTNGLINNDGADNQNSGTNNAIQQSIDLKNNNVPSNVLQKSQSTKKNTASAETGTAQYEITESVEKELSKIMECDEVVAKTQVSPKGKATPSVPSPNNVITNNVINSDKASVHNDINESQMTEDLDIFDNGSTYDKNVHMLKNSYHAASEILPTAKSAKVVTQPEKRDREFNENEEPSPKKFKSMTDKCAEPDNSVSCDILQEKDKNVVADNDSINYDVVMDQVFASIDADIQNSQKVAKVAKCTSETQTKETLKLSAPKKKLETSLIATQILTDNAPLEKVFPNEKYSENVFTIIDKETESHDIISKEPKDNGSTQHHIDNILTPRICQDLASTEDNLLAQVDIGNKDMCTPHEEHYDSDKSVVEETPQKTVSFTKPKNKTETDAKKLQRAVSEVRNEIDDAAVEKSIINVSDSVLDTSKTCKDNTMIETTEKRRALETPLTINRFVNHITHKSTPVARKSLNFDNENIENDDDTEQTLCPSSVVAKTTQEKEFMCEAFEKTQKSPLKRPNQVLTKKLKLDSLKYCIAGSCLTAAELTNLKFLCRKYDWKYVEKYCKELTHLVVRVDEENRSQRSVKYMCALAASKWIVSYEWVVNCLKTNLVVAENQYEVLDGTGEPGPKRSRLAKKKLFQGITFFCMPPFSVLDVEALKGMLEASGGRVVDEVKAVKATAEAPALLLAEPEHTQEDRFMYLALELNIVPVNYEWALNCLGSYSLSSIHELLLCPSALLPKATSKWPHAIISRDSE